MRRLLTSWLGSGSTLLALAVLLSGGMLGCEKPNTEPAPPIPAVDQPAAETPTAETPAVEDATPEEDAAEERKDEENAAGPDPLDTSTKDPNVKFGEPGEPVDLK